MLDYFAIFIKFLNLFWRDAINLLIPRLFALNKVKKLRNKLDSFSLQLMREQRGLPFTFTIESSITLETARHLMNLDLLSSEPFPEKGHRIYRYTKEARLLFGKVLCFPLYPEQFCEMYFLRFWKVYEKDFAIRKFIFKIKYHTSWDKCWDLFCSVFRELPNQTQKKEEEIMPSFESYFKNKDYATIMKEIITPWEAQIKLPIEK